MSDRNSENEIERAVGLLLLTSAAPLELFLAGAENGGRVGRVSERNAFFNGLRAVSIGQRPRPDDYRDGAIFCGALVWTDV